jgi:mRNA-degrading endonuclease RelE of RelBE toxin-antitoxin system
LWPLRSKSGQPLFRNRSMLFRREFVQMYKAKSMKWETRLENFPHRVGDYRVLYEFDVNLGKIYLHFVGNRREIYKRS